MPEVLHLSFSAVCHIHAYTRYGTASPAAIEGCRVSMNRNNIQNNYPSGWVCGVSCGHQRGVRDEDIEENGIKGGIKVTCPKCIEIIKKYGEK